MLSYRHGFHAGNHADVLKHTVLLELLAHLKAKDKAFWYVDTHAGAVRYDLEDDWARKNGEHLDGVSRLWNRTDLPGPVAAYVDAVRALNPDGALRHYPGSPWLGLQALRGQDRLRGFELHGTEVGVAQRELEGDRRAIVQAGDGFAGLKALLPPPPRRALVLIDPSYEDKADYDRVCATLEDALRRFATGVYAIWYPMVQRRESVLLPAQLRALAPEGRYLHLSLQVAGKRADGFGLHGSGMVVVNPPWTLKDRMAPVMPWLARVLAQDAEARAVWTD